MNFKQQSLSSTVTLHFAELFNKKSFFNALFVLLFGNIRRLLLHWFYFLKYLSHLCYLPMGVLDIILPKPYGQNVTAWPTVNDDSIKTAFCLNLPGLGPNRPFSLESMSL